MTDKEKLDLIFRRYNVDNNDYSKSLSNRKQNEVISTPEKSSEKGFEDYSVIYDTTLLPKDSPIASTMTIKKTGEKIIALHDFFDILPQNVRQFILHHEVGHILNNSIPVTEEERKKVIWERTVCIEKHKVHPDELLCDKYAVEKMSINNVIQAIDYLIENFRDETALKELNMRKNILLNNKAEL